MNPLVLKVYCTRYKFRFTHGELTLHGNTVNGKKIMSLISDISSEFSSKWLEESCDESEKEIEVSGYSKYHFSVESDTEDSYFVVPHELLDNYSDLVTFIKEILNGELLFLCSN